ncbi:nicotinate phosphoribosyltransferase [Coprinopsis sp. MPI-PUGE-AT-0042]|nr:nicotinate phosphoribosyltransferase [Coprinopsis sp. MPI-PUGE-AT-0042]
MAAHAPSLAIPVSILDTDLYKFTMQQAILQKFPDVEATYRFTNRNSATTKFSRQCFERFRQAVSRFSLLRLTEQEHEWLAKTCPFFTPSYLEFLAEYRFKPEQVLIEFVTQEEEGEWGDIEITASGMWKETILWEVPLMACLSETYFQTCDKDWDYEGQEESAYGKGMTLLASNCSFSEFGTRRRRSFKTQELVVQGLVRATQDSKDQPGRLSGTSNVHLARVNGLAPIGTIAHEWFMAIGAMKGYENANGKALDIWEEIYNGGNVPLIALTDTFTTKAFFQDFKSSQSRAERWTGLRQDSGSPNEFAVRFKAFYDSLQIDAADKLVVFSDSLSVNKAVELQKELSYGIGTHFTNDFKSKTTGEKSKALNIVIKLKEVDHKPCIKLSDDLKKTTGQQSVVDEVLKLYDIPNKS